MGLCGYVGLERALHHLRRKARPGVCHGKSQGLLVGPVGLLAAHQLRRDADPPLAVQFADRVARVGQQVVDDLAQLGRVALNVGQARRQRHIQVHGLAGDAGRPAIGLPAIQ
ncbi:hypothetical protein D3C86_1071770 [compost metagenome]